MTPAKGKMLKGCDSSMPGAARTRVDTALWNAASALVAVVGPRQVELREDEVFGCSPMSAVWSRWRLRAQTRCRDDGDSNATWAATSMSPPARARRPVVPRPPVAQAAHRGRAGTQPGRARPRERRRQRRRPRCEGHDRARRCGWTPAGARRPGASRDDACSAQRVSRERRRRCDSATARRLLARSWAASRPGSADERRPHREFGSPTSPRIEQQVGDIGGRNREEKADGREQDGEAASMSRTTTSLNGRTTGGSPDERPWPSLDIELAVIAASSSVACLTVAPSRSVATMSTSRTRPVRNACWARMSARALRVVRDLDPPGTRSRCACPATVNEWLLRRRVRPMASGAPAKAAATHGCERTTTARRRSGRLRVSARGRAGLSHPRHRRTRPSPRRSSR